MSKFNKGDTVRVVRGHNKGEMGIVTNPYWQIAANDWPFVLYDQEDGTRGSADESDMELIEDPTFEYAMQRTIQGRVQPIRSWTNREHAERKLDFHGTGRTAEEDPTYGPWTAKIVKRRKAGPVEDA
jgi:hypothetical protein